MSEEQQVKEHPKKPSNIDELRRLKQAKKEAKKKLNSKPQVQQSPPGKVHERSFATVPDQPALDKKSGELCVMTFNVRWKGTRMTVVAYTDMEEVRFWRNP